jgi:hypothetical protein
MSTLKTNTRLLASALVLAASAATPALASVVVDSPGGFALRAGGTVSLGGANEVHGSVGGLGSVTQGWGSFVDGAVEIGPSRTWTNAAIGPFTAGGSNVNLGWSQSIALAAGSYGALTTNSSNTITLGPGQYAFTSFNLGWDGRVVADTTAGDVYLLVAGTLTAGDQTRFQTLGGGRLFIVSGGNASFGYKTEIDGSVYSRGALTFGGETQLRGLAYADGNLSTGYASQFSYIIPGPGALALLPGLLAGRGGRRRRA